MTISDLIARLTKIMKATDPGIQVRIGSAYNSTDNPFDAFEVCKPLDKDEVFLVPSDIWLKDRPKRMAERERQ